MSTNIQNGFRFRSRNLFDIHDIVSRWRIVLAEHHRRDLASLIAEMCSDMIDRNALDKTRFAGKTPYSEARSEIRTRQKEILGSGCRDPEVDFDFEISILPFEGEVYGMVFSERQKWIDAWMAQDGVEDYCYWNHADRPEGIPDAEWARRRRIWSGIVLSNPAGTPGMAGFTAQCADRFNRADSEAIISGMPSFDRRVAKQAKSAAVGLVYEKMEEQERDGGNPFGTLMKIDRWLSGDGKHVLEEETARVESILPRKITSDMVFNALPSVPAD